MKKLSLGSAALVPLFRSRGEEPVIAVKQIYRTLYSEIAPSLPAVKFSDGVLSLAARSAVWRKEGERMAASLVNGLNRALGESVVKRIEFVPWLREDEKPTAAKKRHIKTRPSKELLEASQRIGNERVRDAFVNFGAVIERGRSGRE